MKMDYMRALKHRKTRRQPSRAPVSHLCRYFTDMCIALASGVITQKPFLFVTVSRTPLNLLTTSGYPCFARERQQLRFWILRLDVTSIIILKSCKQRQAGL